jgi:hypothetical protein
MRTLREADWKHFKQVRETALQRFFRQVLDDIDAISRDEALTAQERYLKVYELMQARDRKLCAGFDGLSRSSAIFQLMTVALRVNAVVSRMPVPIAAFCATAGR